ncbi:MAG: DEAD/DEAH box helicase [Saprospiraceae bacterium]|nr:DEAD/DEAH box helicase [Saprospiraceae bacterium]
MTFDDLGLNKPLLNALNDLGYTEPTTIQAKAFAVMLSGKDVIGIAQTGTGKTLAYLLPFLHQWKFTKERSLEPQVVILVPTRELVVQVVEEARKLIKYMNVTVGGIYGGTNINSQVTMIRGGLDILVSTPGRLLDMVHKGELRLRQTKRLIIDEVDEMLDLGFRFQLVKIFDELPEKRQNLMFSATMTDKVDVLIHSFFNYPEKIEAAPTGTPLENIEQSAYYVPNFNTKINLLKHLLRGHAEMSKVLVFAATKKLADMVFEEIDAEFPEKIGVVHANKAQNKRFDTVKLFHQGVYRVLVSTDLIARGIDISEVTHVINMDTPDSAENYMHRIGRTGRADKKGIAMTFITEQEKEAQAEIEELMNITLPISPLPEDLLISDVLIDAEKPQIIMKSPVVKLPKKEEGNAAFHEKSAKKTQSEQ